ncbi:UNVERIFIED_CONTAM: hypothetical protein Sradi_4273200 [Sesamum radiatum]|uniref:Uncharacterized protein n=1 Tax=Sesamum radiatum TaxID=300843 RepID=A0AAW2NL03_SESRA
MDPSSGKPSFLRNILNLNIIAGIDQLAKSSSASLFHPPQYAAVHTQEIPHLWTTQGFQKAVSFYSSVFQDLISDAVLAPNFKALCLETATGADVFALREIGVEDSVGISKKALSHW